MSIHFTIVKQTSGLKSERLKSEKRNADRDFVHGVNGFLITPLFGKIKRYINITIELRIRWSSSDSSILTKGSGTKIINQKVIKAQESRYHPKNNKFGEIIFILARF